MAGQSAKKLAKNAQTKSTSYSAVAIGASAIDMIYRFGYLADFSFWSIGQSLFLTCISWFSYRMILSALNMGVGYELWMDLLIINVTVQIFSIITTYAWIIYLTVPGYGIYMLGGQILGWIYAPRPTEDGSTEGQSKKQKVKYLRR